MFSFKKLMQQCFAMTDDVTVDNDGQMREYDDDGLETHKNYYFADGSRNPSTTAVSDMSNTLAKEDIALSSYKSKHGAVDDKNSGTNVSTPQNSRKVQTNHPDSETRTVTLFERNDEESFGSTSHVEGQLYDTENAHEERTVTGSHQRDDSNGSSAHSGSSQNVSKSTSIFIKQNQIVSPLLAAIRLLEIIEEHKMEFQSYDYNLDDVKVLKDLLLCDNADAALLYPIKRHSLARRSNRVPPVQASDSGSASTSIQSPDSRGSYGASPVDSGDFQPSSPGLGSASRSVTNFTDPSTEWRAIQYQRSFSYDDHFDFDEENRRDKWIDEFTDNRKFSLRSATLKLSIAQIWRKRTSDLKKLRDIAPKILEKIRSFDDTFRSHEDTSSMDISMRRSIYEYQTREKWKKIVRDTMFSRKQRLSRSDYPSIGYLQHYLRYLLPGVAFCCTDDHHHEKQNLETLSDMLQTCHCIDWKYDIFKLDAITGGHSLSVLLYIIFERSGLIAHYDFNIKKVINFVTAVEERMPENSYHNRRHVASFLQVLYSQMCSMNGPGHLFTSPVEWLSLIFAAAVHDLDHLGLNNDYLIKVGHEWALLFNDRSVAENHHAHAAFMMLQSGEKKAASTNFIERKLTLEDYRRFRYIVVELVLATDMRSHFPIVGNIQVMCMRYEQQTKAVVHKKEEGVGGGYWPFIKSKNDDGDYLNVMKLLIKLSDLSHLSLKRDVNVEWVSLLQEEFFKQGDLERSLDIPCSYMMDRNKSHELYEAQPGFFEVIAMPLYTYYNEIFPDAGRHILQQMSENLEHWKKKVKSMKANSPI